MRESSVVSSKGQIVIPAKLRKRYGLQEGTIVVFQEDRGRLMLATVNYAEIYSLQGSLSNLPLEQDLAEETRAAREREDEPLKLYVLDANSVLRYFGVSSGSGADKVRALLQQAELGQARILMSAINLGEVHYVLLRHLGDVRAREYVKKIQNVVTVMEADTHQALQAAEVKHKYKLGYAGSFAATLAMTSQATLVSADPAFEALGKTIRWLRLPKFVR